MNEKIPLTLSGEYHYTIISGSSISHLIKPPAGLQACAKEYVSKADAHAAQ